MVVLCWGVRLGKNISVGTDVSVKGPVTLRFTRNVQGPMVEAIKELR